MKGLRCWFTAGRRGSRWIRYAFSQTLHGENGYALAERARHRGASVTLVSGPVALTPPQGVETVPVETAQEMFDSVVERFPECDIAIKAAAPADFRPREYAAAKIKKDGGNRTLELAANPDIAAELGRRKDKQILVIFAAETGAPDSARAAQPQNAGHGRRQRRDRPGAGLESNNIVTLLTRDGQPDRFRCSQRTKWPTAFSARR